MSEMKTLQLKQAEIETELKQLGAERHQGAHRPPQLQAAGH